MRECRINDNMGYNAIIAIILQLTSRAASANPFPWSANRIESARKKNKKRKQFLVFLFLFFFWFVFHLVHSYIRYFRLYIRWEGIEKEATMQWNC